MGRTGRKREGRIVFLLTEGKEELSHLKSQDGYDKIQKKIASGNEFQFDLDKSPRILPKQYQPDCVKQVIVPPNEGLEALELKVDRRKKVTKRAKNWSMPENVQTGFVKASVLGKRKQHSYDDDDDDDDDEEEQEEGSDLEGILTKEEEEYAKNRRVKVTTKPPAVFDMLTRGKIPAGAVRKRLLRTKKSMNDPTRVTRIYTSDDVDELSSTPPNLIANSPTPSPSPTPVRKRLSPRDWNVGAKATNSSSKVDEFSKLFEALSSGSSDDGLPDLSMENLFSGRGKGKERKESSDDEEYGLPSDYEVTPSRKRIRIEISSDEDE
jgi:hypothetical protein